MKKALILIPLIILGAVLLAPNFVLAQINPPNLPAGRQGVEIDFFYSETCLYCKAEQAFLDKIEPKYPDVEFNRHPVSQAQCREELIDLCQKYGIEKYIGLVPITFVGKEFFLGFDSENGIGKQIENSIQRQLNNINDGQKSDNKIHLPIIGEVDLTKYSLPLQAIILGFFDGFNVCSLGALVLILGLVLILKSRKKIFLFGGLYILVTAIIYGALIFLWYQLFSLLSPVLKIMNVFVGILGIGGGIYFLKQFIKYRKHGPACDIKQNGVVSKYSTKIQKLFEESKGLLAIIIGILIFAAVITIVEFPCSAVIPVLFAGIMAQAKVSILVYIINLVLYIVFYMLDEIIIFLIAIITMNIKIASSKAMVWLSLIEAIVLFGLGIYYLSGIL